MQLFATCAACGRVHDGAGRAAGATFHCACGGLVSLPVPVREVTAASRCDACGAARGPGARCAFCGSGFALHEDARAAPCALCEGPAKDGARFCAACVAGVLSTPGPGSPSTACCPSCASAATLCAGAFGEDVVPFLACPRCGGIWIGLASFDALADLAGAGVVVPVPVPSSPAAPAPSSPFYRACVACGALMQRTNYAKVSGVVIDVCVAHGVWFDGGELPAVLAFVRNGARTRATSPPEQARRALNDERAAVAVHRPNEAEPRAQGPVRALEQLAGRAVDLAVERLAVLLRGR